MNKIILFDLDGTLTESGEGIMKSVQYALQKSGIIENDFAKLRLFIGPPLIDAFMQYYGLEKEAAEKALEYYRERFIPIGMYENRPYPGIPEMLGNLREAGSTLAVASSKPEPFVRRILEYFGITSYFDAVVGSTLDGNRTDKKEVIEETLSRLGISRMEDGRAPDIPEQSIFMVGDKEHDVRGAAAAGIPCVAVLYGYGTRQELEAAKPYRIAATVTELQDILLDA